MFQLLHINYLTLHKVQYVLHAVSAAIFVSPVEVVVLNPAVELNVPPVVPVMVGVGLEPDLQYSVEEHR